MRPADRIAAYERGELSYVQLYLWAAGWPDEVPLVNGEFAFIALTTADAADEAIVPAPDERRRIIERDKRDRVRHPERTIAARLRAEADRLRAIAEAGGEAR